MQGAGASVVLRIIIIIIIEPFKVTTVYFGDVNTLALAHPTIESKPERRTSRGETGSSGEPTRPEAALRPWGCQEARLGQAP